MREAANEARRLAASLRVTRATLAAEAEAIEDALLSEPNDADLQTVLAVLEDIETRLPAGTLAALLRIRLKNLQAILRESLTFSTRWSNEP
ncbi:hypothetical protein ACPF7Z_11100 [Halomonas sp. GXIMD04776]|uniref:hypothetical protein n=1 Tax=Halomonas sp. GXIMD04776 TaxID=3415605 RepID=UPI003CB3146D